MEDSDNTPGWRKLKTLILLTNVDQKSLETEFAIAICHQMSLAIGNIVYIDF